MQMIGIGCDIVKLKRVENAMRKEGFLRILTPKEQVLFARVGKNRQCEWLAGRFAAKEAVIKAMSAQKELLLSQVEILYDGKRPSCLLPDVIVHISIAHEEDYAIAYAMVERG